MCAVRTCGWCGYLGGSLGGSLWVYLGADDIWMIVLGRKVRIFGGQFQVRGERYLGGGGRDVRKFFPQQLFFFRIFKNDFFRFSNAYIGLDPCHKYFFSEKLCHNDFFLESSHAPPRYQMGCPFPCPLMFRFHGLWQELAHLLIRIIIKHVFDWFHKILKKVSISYFCPFYALCFSNFDTQVDF